MYRRGSIPRQQFNYGRQLKIDKIRAVQDAKYIAAKGCGPQNFVFSPQFVGGHSNPLAAVAIVLCFGLAGAAGIVSQPAKAYHEPDHGYGRLANDVERVESGVWQAASDGQLSESEISSLGQTVSKISSEINSTLDARVAGAWETLNETLHQTYDNMTKLETPRGKEPILIATDENASGALRTLKDVLFPKLNQTMYDAGLLETPQGIETWHELASNATKVGQWFNQIGDWASAMYWKYREIKPDVPTINESWNGLPDPAKWRVYGYDPQYRNGALVLSAYVDGTILESKQAFQVKDNNTLILETREKLDLSNGNGWASTAALRTSNEYTYFVEHEIANSNNQNTHFGDGSHLGVHAMGISNSNITQPLDLSSYRNITLLFNKTLARLLVDGLEVSRLTNTYPNGQPAIPTDVNLVASFAADGGGNPNGASCELYNQWIKLTNASAKTIDGITTLGLSPDALALKAYLQNLSKTIDFFQQWLSAPSYRQSQMGQFWSETKGTFRPDLTAELTDFVTAINNPDTNIPYGEPDITPPSILDIKAPNNYLNQPVNITINATDTGSPTKFGIDRLLVKVTSPNGLEELVLAKPNEPIIFKNTTIAGNYKVNVQAFDASNNSAERNATFMVLEKDTIPPIFQNTTLEDRYEVGTEVSAMVRATDDGPEPLRGINRTEIEIIAPGNHKEIINSDERGSFTYLFNASGKHRFVFTPIDKSGNRGAPFTKFVDIWRDITPPSISGIVFQEEIHKGERQQVNVTALDDLVGVSEVSLLLTAPNGSQTTYANKSSTPKNGTFNLEFMPDSIGEYVMKITATDARGNAKNMTQRFNVLEKQTPETPNISENDTTPPIITIVDRPNGVVAGQEFKVLFQVKDDNRVEKVRALVDGSEWYSLEKLTNDTWKFSGNLSKGRHNLVLEAYDQSNNRGMLNLTYNVVRAPQTNKVVSESPTWLPWALLGLAGAGFGGGLVARRVLGRAKPALTHKVRKMRIK